MHELSIAESIVRIADAHAGGRRVAKVEVSVGYLRQVVPAALEFSFQLVAQGTAVEGAELMVGHVPVSVGCDVCGAETHPDGFPLACLACGSPSVTVTGGNELRVEALELEEAVPV